MLISFVVSIFCDVLINSFKFINSVNANVTASSVSIQFDLIECLEVKLEINLVLNIPWNCSGVGLVFAYELLLT